MKTALISFTPDGVRLAAEAAAYLRSSGDTVTQLCKCKGMPDFDPVDAGDWVQENFARQDALIFVGAVGIAVRLCAPCLNSKMTDPAVLVLDDTGTYCIPILSGHYGGANALALRLSQAMDLTPVVTTATDTHDVWAVDVFAAHNDLVVTDAQKAKAIAARGLAGETITLAVEGAYQGTPTQNLRMAKEGEEPDVCVGIHRHPDWEKTLYLVPKVVFAGVGCKRGTKESALDALVKTVLTREQMLPESLAAVATLDRKAGEAGLLALTQSRGVALYTYTAAELAQVAGTFTDSDFVSQVTGVGNVCERSAVRASEGGTLLTRKESADGVTLALAQADWSVTI